MKDFFKNMKKKFIEQILDQRLPHTLHALEQGMCGKLGPKFMRIMKHVFQRVVLKRIHSMGTI